MSILDDFMNSLHDTCDSIMGTNIMICSGQNIPVVLNLSTQSTAGDLGGLEVEITNIATAQPKNVTNPYSLVNKKCIIDSKVYRVYSVDVGTVAINFNLIDPGNSK